MWDDTADAASAICRCLCVSYGGLWDGVGQKPFFAVGVLSHVIVRLLRHLIRSFISGWRAQGIEPPPGHWHIFLSGFAGKAVVLSCPLRVDLQKKVLAPYPPVFFEPSADAFGDHVAACPGPQLGGDTTWVSQLTSVGAALAVAHRTKERRYVEVGGRWSAEAATFLRLLRRAKLCPVRNGQCVVWVSITVAGIRIFAFLRRQRAVEISNTANLDGEPPLLSDVFADSSGGHSPPACWAELWLQGKMLGGLGLLAAERVSPAAYWAAWADALPVLRQRYPDAAARLVQEPEGEPAAPCLRAAAEAARQLAEEGWTSRTEWASCARGADAPAAEGELGLGIPGWQRHAVLALHTSFRERVLLPALAPAARALLHS
eukprot:s7165_g1.t1